MLFNLETLSWDGELLTMMDIPEAILPGIKSSVDEFGTATEDFLIFQSMLILVINKLPFSARPVSIGGMSRIHTVQVAFYYSTPVIKLY